MEVKVQYTAELENILEEVKKLFPASADWAYDIDTAKTYLDKGDCRVTLSIIHSIRQSMYGIDQRLADCQAILGGYLGASTVPREDIDVSQLQDMIQDSEDTDDTTS